MSSTWIFDRRYGAHTARFVGTARLLYKANYVVAVTAVYVIHVHEIEKAIQLFSSFF